MTNETEEQDTFDRIIEAIDSIEPEPDRHLSIQIDQALRDGIRAAQASGSKATITVKVNIIPKQDRRIVFAADVNAKLPRPPTNAATLFADGAGNLHNQDPAQLRMFSTPHPTTRLKDDN